MHGFDHAADPGALRCCRSGGFVAGRNSGLHLVLVAVPPRGHAPAGRIRYRIPARPPGFALRLRRFLAQQGFALSWLAFVPVAAGAAFLSWALVALLTLRLIPIGLALFQAVLTATLYPVLAIPLAWAHRSIAEADRG